MVKIYKQPFAHDGDTIAIPDASQPDGKMSSADGWTPDYQLPKTDPNYKPVGRQEMNGVLKEVTEALGQVQVQGAASWSPDGAPYPVNAQVYHNGKQWLALRPNSVEPVEGEDWTSAWGGHQNIAVFDTAGVTQWSVPAVLSSGLRKAHVTVVGGGGAGGKYANSGVDVKAAGGGGGGTAIGILGLSGVSNVSVTVGHGGTGTVAQGAPGNNGATSSFGAYLSATGGEGGGGGGNNVNSGGAAGSGSGGDTNHRGQTGSDSAYTGGSGDGGASMLGGGGRSATSYEPPYVDGGRYGGGGGGVGGDATKSGDGANGIVIVRW